MKSTARSPSSSPTSSQRGNVGTSGGNIEIGIDLKIGGLGISSGYGGAGVVKLGGQKIVWGRTGGEIQLKVGIFEVSVVAEDCVVTETKKIAGQIVSARTYPDPGCKIPDPEKPVPSPVIPTPADPKGIKLPDTLEVGWVFFDRLMGNLRGYVGRNTKTSISKVSQIGTSLVPGFPDLNPADITLEHRGYWWVEPPTLIGIKKGLYSSLSLVYYRETPGYNAQPIVHPTVRAVVSQGYYSLYDGKWHTHGDGGAYPQTIGFFGPARDIAFILNKWKEESEFWKKQNEQYVYSIPKIFIPLVNPIQGGNRPPMKDKCCELLKADIADIKKVLAVKQILAKKLTFPWRLRMPGGEGEEVILDYPNLARAMVQVIDHLGIHPPKLSIQDINNAIAGDQSVEEEFPSGTRAFEALMAKVWDANADVDTLTNFLYRLSWLCVQQSINLAKMSGDIQTLKEMIGGETEFDVATITTPFNIGAGVEAKGNRGKGFAKSQKIDSRIQLNTEKSTEELLPEFLKIRNNEIAVSKFTGNKDVYDLLSLILLKLESLQAR